MGAAEQYDEQRDEQEAPGASMTAVDGDRRPPAERPEPTVVEVRRNRALAGVVGVVAAAVAIAYLGRATTTGAPLDWALTGVTAVLAVSWLWSLLDARTPLLVADAHGVRVRLGRTWEGLPWRGLDRVEHHPRRGLGRDGRIVLVPRATTPLLEGLDSSGRRHARVAKTLHGAPFAVPLSLSTRLAGVTADEVGDVLRGLAGGDTRIVEPAPQATPESREEASSPAPQRGDEQTATVEAAAPIAPEPVRAPDLEPDVMPDVMPDAEPDAELDLDARTGDDLPADPTTDEAEQAAQRRVRDPRPRLARLIAWLSDSDPRDGDRTEDRDEDRDEDEARSAAAADTRDNTRDDVRDDRADEFDEVTETPAPGRESRVAARSEVRHADPVVVPEPTTRADDLPEVRALRRPGSVDLVGDDEVWGARVRPIAQAGATVEPLAIDDFGLEPAADPVVGPELAAARTRLSLSVDQLAERTRIRPHVIESIEVDDFAPCGGDFYARGHLRTLARVLGVDAAPLLASYDERYSDAPIDPRRVFAAELATGSHGSIRGTRGGPSWSVLVAAVMVVVLAWSVARLVMDDPVDLAPAGGFENQSGGPASPAPTAEPVTLTITAVNAGATVTVTDGEREVRFDDDLAMGESTELELAPPVRIETSDGGAIETTLDGRDNGVLGEPGQPASDTLVSPR